MSDQLGETSSTHTSSATPKPGTFSKALAKNNSSNDDFPQTGNQNHQDNQRDSLQNVSSSSASFPPMGTTSLWATCVVVVNFDLEYGQKLHKMVPQVKFSDDILSAIAVSSFPDCTITERNTVFTFRCRRTNTEPRRWMYGYVFYRQQRDSTIHRGYLQRSVAVLTENNLIDFYQQIACIIGERYFSYGEETLETAWKDILAWPSPQLAHTLSFPILGNVIKYPMPTIRNGSFIFTPIPTVLEAPVKSSKDQKKERLPGRILPSSIELDDRFLYTVPVFAPLASIISKIWLLWELMILGSPILVLSPSPSISSDAVLAIATIISPLEYKGDFRPFFTIHDPDFATFSDDSDESRFSQLSKGGLVVGGTNPYFFKSLSHWKYIVTISGKKHIYQKPNPFLITTNSDNCNGDDEVIEGANRSVGLIDYNDHVQMNKYQTVFPSSVDLKKYIRKPSQEHSERDCFIFNEKLVRYHLHVHTTQFLTPLRTYFDRMIAAKVSNIKAFGGKLPLIGDLTPALLASMKTHLQPARHQTEVQFYESFLATPTFRKWFEKRRKSGNEKIASEWIALIQQWYNRTKFKSLGEMEIINYYQEINDMLKKESDLFGILGSNTVRNILNGIASHLSPDLAQAISSNQKSRTKTPPGALKGIRTAPDLVFSSSNSPSSSSDYPKSHSKTTSNVQNDLMIDLDGSQIEMKTYSEGAGNSTFSNATKPAL